MAPWRGRQRWRRARTPKLSVSSAAQQVDDGDGRRETMDADQCERPDMAEVKQEWSAAPLASPTSPAPPPVPVTAVLPKRRRTVLSIAEKADLIRRMHRGESQRQLALEYGIGTSTVSDVKKHEAEILKYVENNGDQVAMTRRKLENSTRADVEEAVYEWLLEEVGSGRELTGAEVVAQARQEHLRLRGTDDFRASSGWLERFKRRYNIRLFKPSHMEGWQPLRSSRGVTADDGRRSSRGRRRSRTHSRYSETTGRRKLPDYLRDTSPPLSIKNEADNPEDSESGQEEELPHENHLQPQVSVEEAHLPLSIPPVQEIPSANEAAIYLSRALVWAAAQQDTTPQELFVMKQLQTKAVLSSIMKSSVINH